MTDLLLGGAPSHGGGIRLHYRPALCRRRIMAHGNSCDVAEAVVVIEQTEVSVLGPAERKAICGGYS